MSVKEKTAAKVGIESRLLVFPESITEDQLLKEISQLNDDSSVHGIFSSGPLPSHMDERKSLTMSPRIKMLMASTPPTWVFFARSKNPRLFHAPQPGLWNYLKEPM